MAVYHVTDGEGLTLINPPEQRLRRMIRSVYALAGSDPAERDEFEEVTLFNDDNGQALAVFPEGRVIFEDPRRHGQRRRILPRVAEGEALGLWLALIQGKERVLENQPWEWLDED